MNPGTNSKILNSLTHIIFDFDGVFTDNFVLTASNGMEFVRTSRSDSLGLALFRKFLESNKLKIKLLIVSTEENPVVQARAEKLNLECHLGVSNKAHHISLLLGDGGQKNLSWSGVLFLGNDVNDTEAMQKAGFSFAPNNAHVDAKLIATKVFDSNGGDGFVRDALEFLVSEFQS